MFLWFCRFRWLTRSRSVFSNHSKRHICICLYILDCMCKCCYLLSLARYLPFFIRSFHLDEVGSYGGDSVTVRDGPGQSGTVLGRLIDRGCTGLTRDVKRLLESINQVINQSIDQSIKQSAYKCV